MLEEIQNICEILDKGEFTTSAFTILLNEKQISSDAYEMAKKMNIVRENGKNTIITNLGISFFSMSETLTKLSNLQKQFIFERCVIRNEKLKEANIFLLNFEHEGDYIYKLFVEEIEDNDIDASEEMLAMLEELDVIKHNVKENSFEIIDESVKALTKYKLEFPIQDHVRDMSNRNQNKGKKTQAGLELSLKERQRIGKRGEKLALRYERKKLEEKGWINRVYDFNQINNRQNLVANEDLGAGYDISSYKTRISSNVDKYIEVKSRKNKDKSFIISEHEIQAGRKYSKIKNSYFIYFYNNLDKEEPPEPTKIIPFESLKIDICEKCSGLVSPSYIVDISHLFDKE